MFLLKKIVAPFFLPLSLCLELLFAGLYLLWFTKKQKAGRIVVSVGVLFLTAFGYGAASKTLLKPLEYEYPPLMHLSGISDIKWVVVLGGGQTPDENLPVTDQLSDASLARLVEGIRIHNKLPESKLILSGGAVFTNMPEARQMLKVAVALGTDSRNIILEEESRDTKDQARLVKYIVGNDRFVLVTSASHMPRAMALFKKRGMDPVPAPIGHIVRKSNGMNPGTFFPSAGNIGKLENAFREYMGLAWAKIRGQT
jgi:uncharacterized SAM-binding protein YcdF (DUF218 family)